MRPVHGWRRAVRWVFGILAGLFGFVLFALIGAVIVLHTSWGRELLRHQIEARMNDTFVGGATVGSVDGNPLSELVLHDVVINGPDRKPAITAKRLRVDVALLPLVSHQLRVDKVIADDLDVQLKRDPAGGYQISHLTKPGPKSTWSVALPDVQVHRGHVAFDAGTEMIDLDGIELYVDSKIPFGGPLEARATLAATWRERNAPLRIAAVIGSGPAETQIRTALIAAGDVHIAAQAVKIPKGEGRIKVISGMVAIDAPAAAVAQLAPDVKLPADLALAINATPLGPFTQVSVHGAVGGAPVRGFATANVTMRSARGYIVASGLDLGRLSNGKLDGTGGALAAFDVAPGARPGALPAASAIVQTWGDLKDAPHAVALIAVDTAGDRLRATIGAASASGMRAGVGAEIRRDGKTTVLERGVVVAMTSDPAKVTGGRAPLRGAIAANVAAHGRISPDPDLTIAGHVDADRLRFKDISADKVHLRIDARQLPARPVGTARLEIANVQKRGSFELQRLVVAAGNRPDGKLQVSVRTNPRPAPWQIEADALITTGTTVLVDLQRHIVRAGGGAVWHGSTGEVAIAPAKIDVRNFRSTSADGRIALDASYIRAGRGKGDVAAKLDAKLSLTNLGKGYSGDVDTHVDVQRKAGLFGGTVTAKATGVSASARSPVTLDGNAKITVKNGMVTATVDTSSVRLGAARINVHVHGPKDITNVPAWKQLGRAGLDHAEVNVDHLNLQAASQLAGVKKPVAGEVNGSIKITPDDMTGAIQLRGLRASDIRDAGVIDANLALSQPHSDEVSTQLTASISRIGQLAASARLEIPEHLFDPVAWKQLGPRALREATVRTQMLAFEPGTLERFKIYTNLRGKVAFGADIGPALSSVTASVDLQELRGGVITQPIAVRLDAAIDQTSTRAVGSVRAQSVTILQLASKLPITLAQLRADPKAAKTAPLDAVITFPQVPAKTVMNVLGNTQIQSGVLDGKIKLGGTVGKPTADATITARDVAVPPQGTKPTPAVKQIQLRATWDGEAGKVAIDGDETGGGKLRINAQGRPDQLAQVTANLLAQRIEIAPLVAFMPGPAGALGGTLDANLALRGADPRTADLSGMLHVTEGRLPIAPAIGTLFHGDVHVTIKNKVVDLKMVGKLGKGDVNLVAAAPLDGASPTGGRADLTLKKVQMIGTTEPIVDSVISANLARVDNQWRAQLTVDHANVEVPETKGEKLKPAGAPADIVFKGPHEFHAQPAQVDGTGEPPHRRPPDNAGVVAEVIIKKTHVESKELRGEVSGKLTVSANGKEVGVVGTINLDSGDLDLFDRRYMVDRAALHFDGSPDPELDIRITHDFPDVTTITEIRGRMSKPKLVLSSEPGTYSQAELLGFLLGGEPGGDPNNAPSAQQRLEGAGASFIANKIGGYVKQALPVDIDVIRYETASATSSAAVTVGTWITHSLFLAYRHHLEAHPDENTGEGEVEYWLRRRLVLQGTVGDRGYNGLDLLWRRRW